jgi:hypothetical protein
MLGHRAEDRIRDAVIAADRDRPASGREIASNSRVMDS